MRLAKFKTDGELDFFLGFADREPMTCVNSILRSVLKRPNSFAAMLGFVALLGCEGGVPEFTELSKGKIPQPTLAGKTKSTITVTSPAQLIPLSGECDSRVQSLEIKIADKTNWLNPTEVAASQPTVDCKETKSFTMNIKSLSTLGYWSTASEFSFDISLRAVTKAGNSGETVVTVYYKIGPDSKPPIGNLSSGSGASGSTNYKMDARVNFGQTSSASSTSYKIEGATVR